MPSRFKYNEREPVNYVAGNLAGIIVQRSFFHNKPFYLITSGGNSFTAYEHELVKSTGRKGGRGLR